MAQNLPSTLMTFPFRAGLNTKGDRRAKNPPQLDVCKDVEFDDIEGLRTRYPFTADGNSIQGGGTISNARRLATRDGEQLLFTDTALYSWDASQSKWISKGTHLAIDVDEQIRFASNGDQFSADRAELSGVVVYTWSEGGGGAWVAAYNKTTGAVIQPPIVINGIASGDARTHVVSAGTRILLFYVAGTGTRDLMGFAIDPANVTTTIAAGLGGAATTIYSQASGFNLMYDVCRIPGANTVALAVRLNPTTSYRVFTVTSALTVTGSTKARTCVGPIAVSVTADGTKLQVVRDVGNVAGTLKIRGDLIDLATFAGDLFTDQEIGTYTLPTAFYTTVNHIAAAHRSVQNGGQYRCYAFWGFEQDGLAEAVKYNWVDTGNTLGTQAIFLAWCQLGSRAFEYGGSVYVWALYSRITATGGQQGQYLLYRDDSFLSASSRVGNAFYVPELGCLPTVALTDGSTGFRWAGVFQRKVLTTNDLTAVTARAPREIYFTFDSNNARRTVQFGRTLYISGSPILQYDGIRLTEVAFLSAPSNWGMVDSGVAGNLAAGTYSYKATLRSMNGAGEVERSTNFGVSTISVAASKKTVSVTSASNNPAVWTTRKDYISWEIWRTQVNPTAEAPFYLVTSQDPAAAAPNNYLQNSRTATQVGYPWTDNLADAVIAPHETNPEDGGVLESLPPPSARLLVSDSTRLFLSGIAGEPDNVWYSKQRNEGEIAAFNDALVMPIPKGGGDITALAFLNETLIVFRKHAIYAVPGNGFDNTGGGANYGPARLLSLDVGAVNQESIAIVPDGILFKCDKGWYVLGRGWDVQYIGGPVAAYDSETPVSAIVMPAQHQVRILTASRILVWDYLVNQWGEWTIASGLDTAIWSDRHVYLTSTGTKTQQTTYSGVDYGYDVESAWIKINELQGRGIVRMIEVLGEFRAAHKVRVRLARNYESDGAGGWNYNYDKTWTVTPTTVGGPLQVKIAPSIKRPIQAIKVRLTALATGGGAPSDETSKLTGLSLAIAVEEGLYAGLAAGQKQ